MNPERDYMDYLADVLDAMRKVEQFISGMDYDDFSADDKTVFAVIRAIEIIGEATKNVPASVKDRHPEMPWRRMARNARQGHPRISWS